MIQKLICINFLKTVCFLLVFREERKKEKQTNAARFLLLLLLCRPIKGNHFYLYLVFTLSQFRSDECVYMSSREN